MKPSSFPGDVEGAKSAQSTQGHKFRSEVQFASQQMQSGKSTQIPTFCGSGTFAVAMPLCTQVWAKNGMRQIIRIVQVHYSGSLPAEATRWFGRTPWDASCMWPEPCKPSKFRGFASLFGLLPMLLVKRSVARNASACCVCKVMSSMQN